jgi:hypothetical protein
MSNKVISVENLTKHYDLGMIRMGTPTRDVQEFHRKGTKLKMILSWCS